MYSAGNGICKHFDCSNRTDRGYCKTSACINPHYNRLFEEPIYYPQVDGITPTVVKEQPMTNGDYIRNMSDYDLAEWIAEVLTYHGIYGRSVHDDCNHDCPLYKCCNDQSSDNIEDWLKAELR